jgi:hypothetical protein
MGKRIDEMMAKVAGAPEAVLNKYVSISSLRRILDGTVRFTQPSAFNDPFELLPEIITPIDAEERKIPLSFDIASGRQSLLADALEAMPDGCGCSDAMSRDIVPQLLSGGFQSCIPLHDGC